MSPGLISLALWIGGARWWTLLALQDTPRGSDGDLLRRDQMSERLEYAY